MSETPIIVARYRPLRALWLAVISWAFVVLSIWLVTQELPNPKPAFREDIPDWALWSGGAFFCFCALYWSLSIFDKRIQLHIDSEGLMYRRYSRQKIPWTAIEMVTLRRRHHNNFIEVHLRDSGQFPPTTIWMPMFVLNPLFGFQLLTIQDGGLDHDTGDILTPLIWYTKSPVPDF